VVLSTQHAEKTIRKISCRDFTYYTEARAMVKTILDLYE
jgi:hypothetical protein